MATVYSNPLNLFNLTVKSTPIGADLIPLGDSAVTGTPLKQATITSILALTSGLTWIDQTGTSVTMAINTAYVADNAGLVTLTLPTTCVFGSLFYIVGHGAGGWKIAQNASQSINDGNVVTTTGTGGSLASTNAFDVCAIVCTVANTGFSVIFDKGNITYV